MKQLLLLVLLTYTAIAAKSQSISLSLDNEYCPSTEYTFTASLPKPYSSMIGEGGCYVTQSPSGSGGYSVTFKGKFADANQKQIFRVYFSDGSNYPFEFKKIKFLFYSAASSCSIIQPNTGTINAPLSRKRVGNCCCDTCSNNSGC